MKRILLAILCYGLITSTFAQAVKWCVYDPIGGQGPFAQIFKDYQISAQSWSMQMQTQFYTKEAAALNAFEQRQCDVLVASSYQTHKYNAFMGSLGAVGAIQDPRVVTSLLKQIAHPRLNPYLSNRDYQVLGMLPVGFAYFLAEDGQRRKLGDLVNAKMGVIENEIAQISMAKRIGAQPIGVNFDNVSEKLIKKEIDLVPMPIMALETFNLHQQLSLQQYSIVNFPIVFIGLNIIARQGVLDEKVVESSRQWFAEKANPLVKQMMRTENQLPAQYWLDLSTQDRQAYEKLLVKMRQEFVYKKFYHPVFVDLMDKFKCVHLPNAYGCR